MKMVTVAAVGKGGVVYEKEITLQEAIDRLEALGRKANPKARYINYDLMGRPLGRNPLHAARKDAERLREKKTDAGLYRVLEQWRFPDNISDPHGSSEFW